MKKPKYVINTEIENKNLSETQEKIVKAMEHVYANLIKFKKEKNSPLVVMRDGKIVYIKAKEL